MTGIEPVAAAVRARMFRALVPNVDPDAVYRAVREAGGYRSWEDPPRDLHCIEPNLIEVYQVGGVWVLVVNGPGAGEVRECLRLLRCGADRDVHEMAGACDRCADGLVASAGRVAGGRRVPGKPGGLMPA